MWPPALVTLRILMSRQSLRCELHPSNFCALLSGFAELAKQLLPTNVPPSSLLEAAPQLLAHFARVGNANASPLERISLCYSAQNKLFVACKVQGGTGNLVEWFPPSGDMQPEEDEECLRITRLVARSSSSVRSVWTYTASGDLSSRRTCIRLSKAQLDLGLAQCKVLQLTPPLDFRKLADAHKSRLTRDRAGRVVAYVGAAKSETGGMLNLWSPLTGVSETVQDSVLAMALEKLKATARGGASLVTRSEVQEAVVVILDVSASMTSVAFHPPPPPLDGGGNSCSVFLCGLRAVIAPALAKAGAHASTAVMVSAAKAAVVQLVRAQIGIVPRRVQMHVHKETGVVQGSAHLAFATPVEAEIAVTGLDTVTPIGFQGGEKLRAELSPDREASGGGSGRDRLSLVKASLCDFAENTETQDLAHAGGLILCGSEVSTMCTLTPSFTLFWERAQVAVASAAGDGRGGATRLYDAISEAVSQLREFAKTRPGMRLRILVLSDGEDTSGSSPAVALDALQRANVTLDAVLLCGWPGMIAALAVESGGCFVQPKSEAECLSIFQREAMLSLSARSQSAARLTLASGKRLSAASMMTPCVSTVTQLMPDSSPPVAAGERPNVVLAAIAKTLNSSASASESTPLAASSAGTPARMPTRSRSDGRARGRFSGEEGPPACASQGIQSSTVSAERSEPSEAAHSAVCSEALASAPPMMGPTQAPTAPARPR
jgi:hypothetical protein